MVSPHLYHSPFSFVRDFVKLLGLLLREHKEKAAFQKNHELLDVKEEIRRAAEHF
jgi:hypothetical protein